MALSTVVPLPPHEVKRAGKTTVAARFDLAMAVIHNNYKLSPAVTAEAEKVSYRLNLRCVNAKDINGSDTTEG